MLVNFALTQFVPGGPIESVIAKKVQGEGDVLKSVTGSSGDAGIDSGGWRQQQIHVGARGLPPEFLAKLEVQMGFSRIVSSDHDGQLSAL
jgi:microcin C transport system permease protein